LEELGQSCGGDIPSWRWRRPERPAAVEAELGSRTTSSWGDPGPWFRGRAWSECSGSRCRSGSACTRSGHVPQSISAACWKEWE
ncbi:hypothetical protein AK812_SmicGene47964, partial [Symbiodinium microadriaticum]